MRPEWRKCRWGDIATIEYGKSLRGYHSVAGRYRVYGTNGPIGWYEKPLCDHPSVIIGRKGAYRGIHYAPEPFFVIDTAFYLEPKEEMDVRWAYYCLLTYDIDGMDSGSAIPSTSREAFYNLPVSIPLKGEQRAISHILGTLDDKIELNQRMNETLEDISRAIFKSWFVDFDPVRAKADGRLPVGMDAETATLFPDSFEDSPIGRVPAGWRIEQFSDHFSVVKGLSYKGEYLSASGEGLPMHNLDSVYEGGGYKHGGLKWYVGEHKERHLTESGDVVITNTEQGFEFLLIGYPAIIPDHYGPTGLFSHHLYLLKPTPDTNIRPVFMYFLLRTRKYHDLVAGFTNGTTVNMLPADGLERPKFAIPPKSLLDLFYSIVEPIQKHIDKTHEENQILASVRDTFLPKLISGKIRVKDAEKFVEEHAG